MKFNNLYLTLLILIFNQNTVLADEDPAQNTIGERLFLETRFAQAYYANPSKADPVMDKTITTKNALRGPFAGKTMNCRACHMVDEHAKNPTAGMRSYSDFAKRPPVPSRNDGAKTSGRNSMSMVNISIAHQTQENAIFHFDGEFNSMEDLVRATLSGRNYGWQAHEKAIAFKHIANIIRKDSGKDELAQEFGGSYRKVLKGIAKDLPASLRLPAEYRLNVDTASDQQIVNTVAKLISAYVTNLGFSRDDKGQYNGSPYDEFLKLNNLPRKEKKNESLKDYNQRLIKAVEALKNPRFVKSKTRIFASHKQKFVFSSKELQGMKLFFNKGNKTKSGGNCASCHTAPHFSDFGFHNTGLVQQNYDELHGVGEFKKLMIPNLVKRNKNHDAFLPATSKHPKATSRFRSIATIDKPGYTDLGLWNIFVNPDMPAPQQKLKDIMCLQNKSAANKICNNAALLDNTIAAFKTPVLRDLGHSNPYMHTGQFVNLQQAVQFYIASSALAKNNHQRNSERAIKEINLTGKDINPLVAFLKSLNEDYE
jgi:cytochrome c peroxidase